MTVLSSADTSLETEDSVITSELLSVMESASAAEKIPVSIWTTEINADIVEEVALAKTGYNKESIRALVEEGKGDTVTLDDVNNYIAAERRIYAQLQTQANQAFVNDYAFLKTAAATENAYVCSYAPMIVVSLTKSQIETLAKDSTVNTMYYSPPTELKDAMDISLPLINATYNRNTSGYTGAGVKIGMVESGMPLASAAIPYPDNDDVEEDQKQVHFDPSWSSRTSHASSVAEILISNDSTYRGIVPDAELYCTGYSIGLGNFFSSVEWLLESGVNVINMSAHVYESNAYLYGQYTHFERWAEHIAHNHSVHFVVAAGNTGAGVSHPALAYNVITVGAFDDNNTLEITTDDAICTYSSYTETSNADGVLPPNKPDVVAPGRNIVTVSNSGFGGTSAATPHVTGVVAQLIDQYPALAVLQDLMKAILTAAVNHDTLRYTSAQTIGFEKYGAGVIDARACSEISYRGTFVSSAFTASQSNIAKTYTFNVTNADNRIRVSLAWLKSIWYSGSDHTLAAAPTTDAAIANLDLAIISPSGNELPFNGLINCDSNTNLAIIEFDPDVYGTGTYTVNVWIRDSTGAPTYFGLAWWADRN